MKLFIAIKSCHKNADRRAAIASTWLPEITWADDAFFLIGQPCVSSIPDSLMVPVSDSFKNIAPKIQHACIYALDCGADYIFVCDDDTYVHAERLLMSGGYNHDYVGCMRTSGLDYNGGVPYAQGSAYWMSRRAMAFVANSPEMHNGIIDDGAVGRALIDKVSFTHDWRYEPGPYPGPTRTPLPGNNIITCHKCPPAIMQQVHANWSHK